MFLTSNFMQFVQVNSNSNIRILNNFKQKFRIIGLYIYKLIGIIINLSLVPMLENHVKFCKLKIQYICVLKFRNLLLFRIENDPRHIWISYFHNIICFSYCNLDSVGRSLVYLEFGGFYAVSAIERRQVNLR